MLNIRNTYLLIYFYLKRAYFKVKTYFYCYLLRSLKKTPIIFYVIFFFYKWHACLLPASSCLSRLWLCLWGVRLGWLRGFGLCSFIFECSVVASRLYTLSVMLLLVRWAEHPPKWSIIRPGSVHKVDGEDYRHPKGAKLDGLVGRTVMVMWDKKLEQGMVVRTGKNRSLFKVVGMRAVMFLSICFYQWGT